MIPRRSLRDPGNPFAGVKKKIHNHITDRHHLSRRIKVPTSTYLYNFSESGIYALTENFNISSPLYQKAGRASI